MNKVIEEIYTTRKTVTADERVVPVHSEISRGEGDFLGSLIRSKNALKTMEIGCAMGLSTLHICEALKGKTGAIHYVIDPFQMTDWHGIGLKSLERAGLRDIAEFIPERSEVVMPRMLAEHEGSFDFIFIDGWHTFDQTLLESYYALRLLKIGGVLVIDDCDMAGLAKVVKYLENYPSVRRIGAVLDFPENKILALLCRVMRFIPLSMDMRHRLPVKAQRLLRRPNMIALGKITQDERRWNWYKPF